jgi:hypothetical protein
LIEFPLSCQTLRKRQPVQVVLIHGLFCNGAFWIPYLRSLENFQLTLLTVDYAAVLMAGASLGEVAERADQLICDKPAHLIGHSFGSWPTFASLEFRAGPFCAEISKRTAADESEIAPLVARAIEYKERHVGDLSYRSSDNFYLSCDDPYFRYVERLGQGTAHRYSGGHFDVADAVEMIADRLSLNASISKTPDMT